MSDYLQLFLLLTLGLVVVALALRGLVWIVAFIIGLLYYGLIAIGRFMTTGQWSEL